MTSYLKEHPNINQNLGIYYLNIASQTFGRMNCKKLDRLNHLKTTLLIMVKRRVLKQDTLYRF
ncbi:hypothetical protein Ppb6_00509 [Photorhabdus australis subsp. thailandensis]|uniref:Uncharacterized protein n=1 Tax=Photorhabdus australis subsp. thailandensis TaxID=2805096 RepID=A0A1C0U8D6_9GAMM|nr:hypothetical protein Ppb6_00509 [Photorhabdus australis subsp. thailandensis]